MLLLTATKPGEQFDAGHDLTKPRIEYPDLEDENYFPRVVSKKIRVSRRNALCESICRHIRSRFSDRDYSVDIWWTIFLDELDKEVDVSNENVAISNTIDVAYSSGITARTGARALGKRKRQ